MRVYPTRFALYGTWFAAGFLAGTVFLLAYNRYYVGDSPKDAIEQRRVRVVQPLSTGLRNLGATVANITDPVLPTKPSLSTSSSSSLDELARDGCPKVLRLLLLIMSSPFGASRRSAIRRSWLQLYRRSFDTVITAKFVIGTKNLLERKHYQIMNESQLYHDIVFLDDLADSYHNLTWKVLRSLTLAYEGTDFHFLVKLDDDSFVQINSMTAAIRQMRCPRHLYWGYFVGHALPEQTGKWAEKHWFICPHYIPYAMGGGYVLSWKLVQLVTRFSDKLILYHNEDVSMGAWVAPYDVEHVHELRFNTEAFSRGCNNNYIITHKEKAASFLRRRRSILLNGTLCEVETEKQPAFLYNWTNSPLNCCERRRGIPVPPS